MDVQVLDGGRDVTGGYKVDVSRGERMGRVSSEWFNRPDDERFLSLDDLFAVIIRREPRSCGLDAGFGRGPVPWEQFRQA